MNEVLTPDGWGQVLRTQSAHGRTSYLVKGAGFEGWYDGLEVTADFADQPDDVVPNNDNSTALPYPSAPQGPGWDGTTSTIQPNIDPHLDMGHSSDSLTGDSTDEDPAGADLDGDFEPHSRLSNMRAHRLHFATSDDPILDVSTIPDDSPVGLDNSPINPDGVSTDDLFVQASYDHLVIEDDLSFLRLAADDDGDSDDKKKHHRQQDGTGGYGPFNTDRDDDDDDDSDDDDSDDSDSSGDSDSDGDSDSGSGGDGDGGSGGHTAAFRAALTATSDLHFLANLCVCAEELPLHSKSEHRELLAEGGLKSRRKKNKPMGNSPLKGEHDPNRSVHTPSEAGYTHKAKGVSEVITPTTKGRKKLKVERPLQHAADTNGVDAQPFDADKLHERYQQDNFNYQESNLPNLVDDPGDDADDADLYNHYASVKLAEEDGYEKYIGSNGDGTYHLIASGGGKLPKGKQYGHYQSHQDAHDAVEAIIARNHSKAGSKTANEGPQGTFGPGDRAPGQSVEDWANEHIEHQDPESTDYWKHYNDGYGAYRNWYDNGHDRLAQEDLDYPQSPLEMADLQGKPSGFYDGYEDENRGEWGMWPHARSLGKEPGSLTDEEAGANPFKRMAKTAAPAAPPQPTQIESQIEQLMQFWAVDNNGWWHWTGSQSDLALLNQMQQQMMAVGMPQGQPGAMQAQSKTAAPVALLGELGAGEAAAGAGAAEGAAGAEGAASRMPAMPGGGGQSPAGMIGGLASGVQQMLGGDGVAHHDIPFQAWSFAIEPETPKKWAEYLHVVASDKLVALAAWADVVQKSKRLRAEGAVDVEVFKPEVITAFVQGDHGRYYTTVQRLGSVAPGVGRQLTSTQVSGWSCECEWGHWAWLRKRSFVGRMCSHAYALFSEMRSLDAKARRPDKGKPGRFASTKTAWTRDGEQFVWVTPDLSAPTASIARTASGWNAQVWSDGTAEDSLDLGDFKHSKYAMRAVARIVNAAEGDVEMAGDNNVDDYEPEPLPGEGDDNEYDEGPGPGIQESKTSSLFPVFAEAKDGDDDEGPEEEDSGIEEEDPEDDEESLDEEIARDEAESQDDDDEGDEPEESDAGEMPSGADDGGHDEPHRRDDGDDDDSDGGTDNPGDDSDDDHVEKTSSVAELQKQFGLSHLAGANYSLAQQAALVGEGEGKTARNHGDLDISKTHYEASASDADPEDTLAFLF